MYRESALKFLTPEQAVLALFQEFGDEFGYDTDAFAKNVVLACESQAWWSGSWILRTIRMFYAWGFTPEELMSAAAFLESTGVIETLKTRRPRSAPATNPYGREVVDSGWAYPYGFTPMSLERKVRLLSAFFPFLTEKDLAMHGNPEPYDDMEMLAVVTPSALAREWKIADPYGTGYLRLVERLADMVRAVYRRHPDGYGFAKTPLDLGWYTRYEMEDVAARSLRRLEARSGGRLAAFPGQMGLRWKGSSVRRVLWHCRNARHVPRLGWEEFVLPAYVVLMELLVQPERLIKYCTLGVYCGDTALKRTWLLGDVHIGFAFGHDALQLIDGMGRADAMFGVATGLAPV